ncbi:MAG: HAD family hydrolase [Candidatus Lokiarchaeota archaeon]|nr:HAD family hydrolase [Candidatus Lokiarchaeota archaeon]
MIDKSDIKAIFFDLYGTLLICEDLASAWTHWFSTFFDNLKNRGLNLSKSEFKIKCDNFFGKQEPMIQKKKFTVFEHRIISLCNDIGLTLEEKDIKEIALACLDAWQEHMTLDPEAIIVLKTLKQQYALALISNFDHPPHVYSLLANLNLRNFFDSIVISADVGVKKPDPSIFSFALKEIGLHPNNCIYIGDENIDSIAAKTAGIHSITIKREQINQNQGNSFYKSNFKTKNESSIIIFNLSTLIKMLM